MPRPSQPRLSGAAGGCPFSGGTPAESSEGRTTPDDLAQLAAIVDSSDDAIISRDLSGVITTWNRGAQRLFGYAPAEVVGKPLALLIPAEHLAEEAEIVAQLGRGEPVEHYETTRIAKGGRLLAVSLTVSPIRDDAGRIVGASKIVRDIGPRKKMAREVGQDRSRLQAILDTAIDAIISIDGRGLIQSINRATERMFGYAAGELIGQNVKILMPSPYREEHDGYLVRYKQTGEKRIIGIGREVMARRKDGTVFAIDLAVSEVEPGTLFTGIIRDISDRKEAEEKLREADRMASIGTLAAGLGHDMNNVLLPVRARLNALSAEGRQGKLTSTAASDVAEIIKSVAYLQQLADGLHFLAMDPENEDGMERATNLAAWWAHAGALISKAVPKHVRVTASIPADLPQVAAPASGLTQAVLNLVVNAGAAIPSDRKRGQGHVRILAETAKGAAHVTIRVADNGRGMSTEVKRRAFDMFFTTKPRGLGTGLGLTLVRKVADQAGGAVEIESTLGHGTTVSITLPVVARGGPSAAAPFAVISLADGRAVAMLRYVFDTNGVRTEVNDDPTQGDIWVTEPTTSNLRRSHAWRKRHPDGRMVLFGRPDRAMFKEWTIFRPVIIEDRYDLTAIRAGLSRAIGGR